MLQNEQQQLNARMGQAVAMNTVTTTTISRIKQTKQYALHGNNINIGNGDVFHTLMHSLQQEMRLQNAIIMQQQMHRGDRLEKQGSIGEGNGNNVNTQDTSMINTMTNRSNYIHNNRHTISNGNDVPASHYGATVGNTHVMSNRKQGEQQRQPVSHRSSSRLLQTIIDGSNGKHTISKNKNVSYNTFETDKSIIGKGQQNQNCMNYTQGAIHNNIKNQKIGKIRALQKDFGHIDRILKEKIMEPKLDQLRHHKLSNLSSLHQYDDQDLQNNKNGQQSRRIQADVAQVDIEQDENQQYDNEDQQQIEEDEDCVEMLIQLDSNTSIPLKIYGNQDPMLLSKQFCYSNNIDPKIIGVLAKQIKQLQEKKNRPNTNTKTNTNVNINSRNSKNGSNTNNSHNSSSHKYNSNNINRSVHSNYSQNTQQNYHNADRKQNNPQWIMKNNESENKNTKNNTTVITHNQQNYDQMHVDSTDCVFDRLYRNSQSKAKKQQLIRNKQKLLQSQQQLRNYSHYNVTNQGHLHNASNGNNENENSMNYQNSKESNGLNQSTTYINNLSNSNINTNVNVNANINMNMNMNNSQQHSSCNLTKGNKDSMTQIKIYHKNVKLQKQTRSKNQHIKKQLQQHNQRQYTGHPDINPLSRMIVSKLRQIQYNSNQDIDQNQSNTQRNALKDSCVRLYERSKSKQKKIVQTIAHIKNKQQEQLRQCTFHPKILKKSQCQQVNTQRYLLLHQDFYIRENKMQTVKASQNKIMFQRRQPQINQVSKRLVQDRGFQHRMADYKVNAQRNRQRIERERGSEQRYRPQINKNSKNNKNSNISIGQYLYQKSQQKVKKRSQSTKNISKPLILPSSKVSSQIYQQMKKTAFRYIFTLMDSDEDGYISSHKINILGLETEILHLLAPLLCQMEQVEIELDEEEFVEALDRLFKTFSVREKDLVVNVYKNPLRKQKNTSNQPSFHPSLNEKSIQIAKEVRDSRISLYEIGKQRQLQRQSKLNELRALKALIQIQQCTFHPNLLYHHP